MPRAFRLALALATIPLLVPVPVGGAERPFGLAAECSLSHRAPDDPIVYPRQPGASHSHDFFGNRSTDAHSTYPRLRRGATSCRPSADRSAYWVPTLSQRGRPLRPGAARFYYVVVNTEPGAVTSYPPGLRVIAGNERSRETAVTPPYAWTCSGTTVLQAARIPRCPRGSELVLHLRFPDCWDGRRRDSRDHHSHMKYGRNGTCPESHPVAVPQLRFEIRYRTRGGRRTQLASGPVWTTHGDFVNAWDPNEFEQRLRACIADRSCVEDRASYDGQ
jgi:hypothetical protein